MERFPSLGDNTTASDILRKSPEAGVAPIQMHEEVMRRYSALSERGPMRKQHGYLPLTRLLKPRTAAE